MNIYSCTCVECIKEVKCGCRQRLGFLCGSKVKSVVKKSHCICKEMLVAAATIIIISLSSIFRMLISTIMFLKFLKKHVLVISFNIK